MPVYLNINNTCNKKQDFFFLEFQGRVQEMNLFSEP